MKFSLITCAILLLNIVSHAEDVRIVAHRGASQDAPENTLPAFQLAWQHGADAIEGDFHLTKDGYVVCIHDENTKRVSGENFVVRNVNLAELRKLDVGVRFGKEFKGTIVPTIAEVFASVPDQKMIYVEIKCGPEIIPALLEEIKKSGLNNEQVLVICFNEKVIQELKAKAPDIKASWLSSFKKDRSGNISPSLDDVLTTLKQINADGFSSAQKVIDEAFIKGVMEGGFEYHVWTVDDIKTAKRFKDWGAKSITTNVPEAMKQALVEEGVALDESK